MSQIVPPERIEQKIYLLRGHKVMLSPDLADLYGVIPKILLQAVKRNIDRFPKDFMFQLTKQEFKSLRSQIVTLEGGRGRYPKYPPYAFTEQGVAMLASVLNSKRAVQVNIAIMRTFVKLRSMLASNKELARRLDTLEKKYDAQFRVVFDAIRKLMEAPSSLPKKQIGFHSAGRRA
jgi:phage regulator Rha-like protein